MQIKLTFLHRHMRRLRLATALAVALVFTSLGQAYAINCEALANMPASEANKISSSIIEGCIMSGFDPPLSWREAGGTSRGVGSASGAITPVNKCRGDGQCPTNNPSYVGLGGAVQTMPNQNCVNNTSFSLRVPVLGISINLACDCVNNYIRNLPANLTANNIRIPCSGGTFTTDALDKPCVPAHDINRQPVDAADSNLVSKLFPCGGSLTVGPQSTVLSDRPDFLIRTHKRGETGSTHPNYNYISIYRAVNISKGQYALVGTRPFTGEVTITDPRRNIVNTPLKHYPPVVTYSLPLAPPNTFEAINKYPAADQPLTVWQGISRKDCYYTHRTGGLRGGSYTYNHLWWDTAKCPLDNRAKKQLTIREEIIGVKSGGTFAVHFENVSLVALFSINAAGETTYVLTPSRHESGLTEPTTALDGIRVVHGAGQGTGPINNPTQGGCTFSHLPAPTPCRGYMLSANQDQRLLILPPDRFTYEGTKADGTTGPIIPVVAPADMETHPDSINFRSLGSSATNFIKTFVANNVEETLAMFPEDSRLEFYGEGKVLLMDGGYVVLKDGKHLHIPTGGLVEFTRATCAGGVACLQYYSDSRNGGAFTSGEDSGNSRAGIPADSYQDLSNKTFDFPPEPYNAIKFESRVPPLHVENPLYPGYPAVVIPRGVFKILDKKLLFPIGVAGQNGELVLPSGEPYSIATTEVATCGTPGLPACPATPDYVRASLGNPTFSYVMAFNGYIPESARLAKLRLCPATPTVCPIYDDNTNPDYDGKFGRRSYPVPKGVTVTRDSSGTIYTSNGFQIRFLRSEGNNPHAVNDTNVYIYRNNYYPETPPPDARVVKECGQGAPGYSSDPTDRFTAAPADQQCRDGEATPVVSQPPDPTPPPPACVPSPTTPCP